MDQRIKVELEPFRDLPDQIMDLENHFDVRSREMSGSDLEKFKATLDKVKKDVRVLQQHQFMVLVDQEAIEFEGELPLINLTGEPIKKKKR